LSEASREDRYQAEVEQNLRRNYVAHLAHGMLGQTGFRLIQAPTFIEAYVASVSSSPLALGAVRACQSFGMSLSPILGATAIEHRRRVLPVGFIVGGLMRLQLLGLALAVFFMRGQPALVALGMFLGLFGFFMGMQGVIFSFLMSKVIPVRLRGRLMGFRNALAGLAAGLTGWVGGQLVESSALGNGFATTFGLAFVLTTCGLLCLLLVREPEPPDVRASASVGRRLRELPALLRSDPEFTRYFLARALATLGRMSMPFYVPFAATQFEVGGAQLGVLTLAFVMALSVANLGWGVLADRTGFRAVFIGSLVVWIGSVLLLMAMSSEATMVGVMLGLGAGQGGFMMSSQNLVLEFGSRENLPMRIAVANSASELLGGLGTLAAGVLASAVSMLAVFWTGIAFQVSAVVWVAFYVRDPRHR
jgi:predicted MFS family arabinose efflux permease